MEGQNKYDLRAQSAPYQQKKSPQDLVEKIINLKSAKKDKRLREIVVENYNLDNLIDKIISKFHYD